MRKVLTALLVVLGFAGMAMAQGLGPGGNPTPIGGSDLHQVGAMYFSAAYNTWSAKVISGNATTGSGATIIVSQPSALGDGYVPSATSIYGSSTTIFVPITIADGVSETITPTAVAVGACPVGTAGPISFQCATITATINNTHGQGAFLLSGDQGIAEALNDAWNAGGGLVFWIADTGVVTLNTGGLTTTTTTKVPNQFLSEGAAARVTTTITTSANWAVGVSGTTGSFCTANSTLTAGTNCIANMNSPTSVGTSTLALTAVLLTMGTSNPGAGAIHSRVWGFTAVQPAF